VFLGLLIQLDFCCEVDTLIAQQFYTQEN